MNTSKHKDQKDMHLTVQESPLVKINRCGNLTGNVRVLKDHIVDIYDLIHAWNQTCVSGTGLINDITDAILKQRATIEETIDDHFTHQKLQQLFDNLGSVCEQLESIVSRIELHYNGIQALVKLETAKNGHNILFLTWPLTKFDEVSERVYEMFRKELSLKCRVKKFLTINTDKSTLYLFTAYWLYHPYIDDFTLDNFMAMIKETTVLRK